MRTIQDMLEELNERHPIAAPVLYFVVVLALLLIMAWFLLFSGVNTTADFVYNQF